MHSARRTRLPAIAAVVTAALTLLAGCSVGDGSGGPSGYRPPTDPASAAPVARDAAAPPAARTPMRTDPPPAPRTTAGPTPTPVNHCAANTAAQLVLVDISAQHAWYCAGTRTVYSTAVTTGMDTPDTATPLGHFRIQGKDRGVTLRTLIGGRYHDFAVKYWIPFDAPLFGFHDSSWQDFPYGSAKYRTDGSHGCVHLPLAAIEYLYRWSDVGASVYIRA